MCLYRKIVHSILFYSRFYQCVLVILYVYNCSLLFSLLQKSNINNEIVMFLSWMFKLLISSENKQVLLNFLCRERSPKGAEETAFNNTETVSSPDIIDHCVCNWKLQEQIFAMDLTFFALSLSLTHKYKQIFI